MTPIYHLSYAAAEQSGMGFKLFISFDMSYVQTLVVVQVVQNLLSDPSLAIHQMMPSFSALILWSTQTIPISSNTTAAPLFPLSLAKAVNLANPLLPKAGRRSSPVILI